MGGVGYALVEAQDDFLAVGFVGLARQDELDAQLAATSAGRYLATVPTQLSQPGDYEVQVLHDGVHLDSLTLTAQAPKKGK